jgi:DNA-binding MarR family transcriptional regulator
MDINYQLLHELIDQLGDFQKENPNGSVRAFSTWLSQKVSKEEGIEVIQVPAYQEVMISIDSALVEYLTYMYRYAKVYVKKVVEESESAFVTYDDVVYVLILFFNPYPMTKTELIERNIHEKPTGMEVLKRLVKNGLIEQYANEEDRRSKFLKVTAKGKNEFMKIFDKMHKVSQLVAGNLSHREKEYLFFLLKKLDNFHNPIFLNDRALDIVQLLKKISNISF